MHLNFIEFYFWKFNHFPLYTYHCQISYTVFISDNVLLFQEYNLNAKTTRL